MENVLALSTCLKIENGCGGGVGKVATQLAPVHVVRGQATIQSNRKYMYQATTTTATKPK